MKTPGERGKGAPRPTASARVRARVQRPLEAVERFAAGDFAPTIYIEGMSEALGVITASYEYHGGFRLRTLAS